MPYVVLVVGFLAVAIHAQGGVQPADAPLPVTDVMITMIAWGNEVPAPGDPARVELEGHRVAYYVGPTPIRDQATLEARLAKLAASGDAVRIRTGPGVTVQDVITVADAALRAGIAEVELSLSSGTRTRPTRSRRSGVVHLRLAEIPDGGAALATAAAVLRPKRSPDTDTGIWVRPGGELAVRFDVDQAGAARRRGKPFTGGASAAPSVRLADALRAESGRQPIVPTPVVACVDRWTEIHHVIELVAFAAGTEWLDSLYLGVRRDAGDPVSVKEPARLLLPGAQAVVADGVAALINDRAQERESAEHARAIGAALRWLTKHQHADGCWLDPQNKPDVERTGLALLAMLGDGSTMRSGPHREAIKRAVIWLKGQQAEDGAMKTGETVALDAHAMATLAMTEAYALSRYRTLRRYTQRAVDYLVAARGNDAGWPRSTRHDGPNDGAGGEADLWTTAWALEALRFATAAELRIGSWQRSPKALHGALTPNDRIAGETWVEVLIGGQPFADDNGQATLQTLLKRTPRWAEGAIEPRFWLHATAALFASGGEAWTTWSDALQRALFTSQASDGEHAGSWPPDSGIDRTQMTAMCSLCLQADARYRRTPRKD